MRLLGIAAAVGLAAWASLAIPYNGADAAKDVYELPQQAANDPDFVLQGEYVGKQVSVQVVAQGDGEFLAIVFRGGLPGAGWDGQSPQRAEEDTDGIEGLIEGMRKVQRKSPTLGVKPAKGAVVLFDGTEASLKKHWKQGARLTADGLLMQGCTSLDQFQDFVIHLEFRLPYMPKARGQGRGNSGLYYQGRYETQILDSFGLEGQDNECGGLYSIKAPDLNMCLPPLSWQTYDAEFTAARYDDAGKKIANTRLTARLNGVIVHNDVDVPRITTAAPVKEANTPGPIYLQDHGAPVRYRNIWVLRRKGGATSRPIVPGFERFHTSLDADAAAGGRMLLGELNCVSCHQADAVWKEHVDVKQAPILSEVGKRVHRQYLFDFLSDPQSVKLGTTMPNLLAGVPAEQKAEQVEALVHFLASTGEIAQQPGDRKAARQGETLFHSVGCLACHAPRNGKPAPRRTSISLDAVDKKYSVPSLTAFLENPHRVRPSGRMPALSLQNREAFQIANYLLKDAVLAPQRANLRYQVYHEHWETLPDFDKQKVEKSGECAGFDLFVAGRDDSFGIRFEGFLKIQRDGAYRFHLGSDDGSRLSIDGKEVVPNDGVHPHSVKSETVELKAGMHPLRVDYFEAGGQISLTLEIEGPGLPRTDATPYLFLTPEESTPSADDPEQKDVFVLDAAKAEQGRKLFATLGCAACHEMNVEGSPVQSSLASAPMAKLNVSQGCLSEETKPGVPFYSLSGVQREAISAALQTPAPSEPPAHKDRIARTMTTFNCYTCHQRNGVGGPERSRNALFLTKIQEMGDEGRVPPPLDGVGDKLREDWLKKIMQDGATDRPYMQTRMPKFGMNNVGHLVPAFLALDRQTGGPALTLDEPPHRVLSAGRHLVGGKALACIKCHSFGKYRGTGIQAMNLHTMTSRVREDWFHRYMIDPQVYRPGTRMPSPIEDGVSAVRDVYAGDAAKQLVAVWTFLTLKERAPIPFGLVTDPIELTPETEPIIYRNFIDGLSARGIAVGYPEKLHLAFDAERLALTLVWNGAFIDAAKHWVGRGSGFQTPLGDNVLTVEKTLPFAVLESNDSPWPDKSPREQGYRFRGYSLDVHRRPTFRYSGGGLEIADFPKPIVGDKDLTFERTLTVTAQQPIERLFFRAGTGKDIVRLEGGSYQIDGAMRVTVTSAGKETAFIRSQGGHQELLLPVTLSDGKATIVQQLRW